MRLQVLHEFSFGRIPGKDMATFVAAKQDFLKGKHPCYRTPMGFQAVAQRLQMVAARPDFQCAVA
jgi:hypothetical protein